MATKFKIDETHTVDVDETASDEFCNALTNVICAAPRKDLERLHKAFLAFLPNCGTQVPYASLMWAFTDTIGRTSYVMLEGETVEEKYFHSLDDALSFTRQQSWQVDYGAVEIKVLPEHAEFAFAVTVRKPK